MSRDTFPTVTVEGIPFCGFDLVETSRYIVGKAASGLGGWVVTPNVDILRRIVLDSSFRALVSPVDLFTADGAPIVWAARLQGKGRLPERVAGSDLFHRICADCATYDLAIALVGGNPGAASAAGSVLQSCYSGLRVVGTVCPEFGFERSERQLAELDEFVRESTARIVFVGLGSPKQEILISRLRTIRPDIWWVGVGITFSFVAGEISRAPKWMQRIGLEWFYRMMLEPKRLVRRYLIDDLPFALRMLFVAIVRKREY